MDRTFGRLDAENRERLVGKLLTQCDIFDGLARKQQSEALEAAVLLTNPLIRPLVQALVTLTDSMGLLTEAQQREVVEAAADIAAGRVVQLTDQGEAARLQAEAAHA